MCQEEYRRKTQNYNGCALHFGENFGLVSQELSDVFSFRCFFANTGAFLWKMARISHPQSHVALDKVIAPHCDNEPLDQPNELNYDLSGFIMTSFA